MAIRFVTVAQARVVSGITSTLIDDADMTELIEDVEYQVEKFLNSNFTPAVEIDVQDGNRKSAIFTRRSPLLSVRSLETNDATIDLTSIDFKRSGLIRLTSDSQNPVFTFKRKGVIIKYVYGRVQWDKLTSTDTTSASTAGTSVALAVTSETDFATDDWIEIFGTDGNREAAQITSTAASTITVDELINAHNSGSLIRLLAIDKTFLKLIKLYVGIAANVRAEGQSFADITGYTIEGFQVQKGEPFTQFREAIIQLTKQKDEVLSKVRGMPGIVI